MTEHRPLATERVAVIGATTWGTALGIILARRNVPVDLVVRSEQEACLLESQRENARFLPGVAFPEALTVTPSITGAVPQARMLVIAVPSHTLRANLENIRESVAPGAIILNAAKGLEWAAEDAAPVTLTGRGAADRARPPEGKRMSRVMEEALPPHLHDGICSMSGPNLAREIVNGKVASTVVAGRDAAMTERAQSVLMSPSFRVYTSEDVIGVELGGALKNIIALGAGIADGLNIGDNGKAALITRGLAEITRLGVAAGAHPLTFAGLAGLGDLIATCASRLSRNRYVGEQLAQGRSWPDIQKSMNNIAEGVNTTRAALAMAEELNVELPITQATYRVLFEGLSPRDAISELMERPPRSGPIERHSIGGRSET